MTDAAVYEDVRNNLQVLRNFLQHNDNALRSGIDALGKVVPQIRHLPGNLISMMEQFRETVEGLKAVPWHELETLANFSDELRRFLASNPMLPEEPEARADMDRNTQLMSGVTALVQMREELTQLTDDIIFQVRGLRGEEHQQVANWGS